MTTAAAASIGVGVAPTGIAISRDGARAYVTNSLSDTVSVIDTATNTVTGSVPVPVAAGALAVSADGRWLYVADMNGDTVRVIAAPS